MSQSRVADQLHKDNVIPDVLPEGTTLSHDLVINWPPHASLDTPGKELGRQETQSEPSVHVNPAPQEKRDDYVLIMTDPDLMSTNDTKFGQVRHWLATGLSIKENGEAVIPSDANVSPYVGPAPLPNPKRPHRYVFILCKPTGASAVNISKEDMRASQKDYSAAFEGQQELQDLKDRWGFHAQQLIESKGLVPVAATYMLVSGNLQSMATNLGLTATAGMNKVMGK